MSKDLLTLEMSINDMEPGDYYASCRFFNKLDYKSKWTDGKDFTVLRRYINPPAINIPDGFIRLDRTVNLTCAEFSVSNDTDTFVSSDWKITSDPEGNEIIVENVGFPAPYLFCTFNSNSFKETTTHDQTLYAWVRHNGEKLGHGDWSCNPFLAQHGTLYAPVISSVKANGTTSVTINSGSFSYTGWTNSWAGTNYRICKSNNVDDVLYEGNATTVPCTVSVSLERSTTYYVFIRYIGQVYGITPWSMGSSFKTA